MDNNDQKFLREISENSVNVSFMLKIYINKILTRILRPRTVFITFVIHIHIFLSEENVATLLKDRKNSYTI